MLDGDMMLKFFIGLVVASIVLAGTAVVLRTQLLMRRDSSLAIQKAMEGTRYFSGLHDQIRIFKLRSEMSPDDRGLADAYLAASVSMAVCLIAAIVVSSYAL